jgi:AP2-associated kinase
VSPPNSCRALQLCRAVASVLAALHDAGVAHWDLKPENVLRAKGEAGWKLCDFGSASTRPDAAATPRERGRLEDAIQRRTTPACRAPEMWDLATHATIGPASDVWALGCLLGAALGAPPFCAQDKLRILSGAFKPPPRASPGVVALQQRALAVSPEARPTADALIAQLDALLDGHEQAQQTQQEQPALPARPVAAPPLSPLPHAAGADAAALPQQAAADAGWCAQFD